MSVALEKSTEANVMAFEEVMILKNRAVGKGMRPVTYEAWFVEGLLRLRHDTMNACAVDMFDFIVGRRVANVDSVDG